MEPTLRQGNQVLNLILQLDVSDKQLQAHYEAGLLTDLLKADPAKVDREKFRGLLSLNPFLPSFTIGVSDTSDLQPPYKGWEVLEDAKAPVGTLELKLAEFLEKGERSVSGEEMLKRAKKMGFTLGLRHAKALLAKEDRIPKEWRKYYLVFPGSVWKVSLGGRRVLYLYWREGGWSLRFRWLGLDWGGYDRLVVCK